MSALEKVRNWEYIPNNAFLHFPQGQEIKVGDRDKVWRKIFEDGSPYDKFQEQKLKELDRLMESKSIRLDSTVDKANKLRYLQANKFDIKKTTQSLEQYSQWRGKTTFPIKLKQQHLDLIQSGAFYICGRDDLYRPIIVIDIERFDVNKKDMIPQCLVVIMEFMLSQLLIEGQVQNYILIMNLQAFSMSMRSVNISRVQVISEILKFTSNSYRGRLYGSYFLSMPSILSWGWESFASSFVSQNTLKKIQVSKQSTNTQMWKHISKENIQKKYGGNKQNIRDFSWPPPKEIMSRQIKCRSKMVTVEEYNQMYRAGKLSNRKVEKTLLVPEKDTRLDNLNGQKSSKEVSEGHMNFRNTGQQEQSMKLNFSGRGQTNNVSSISKLVSQNGVKKQIIPKMQIRTLKTFFCLKQYQSIKSKH